MSETFGERLRERFAAAGQLCVGIDPHPYLLADWGLSDSADGAREFGLRVVEAAAGQVGLVKPQIGFFERFGSAGFQALEAVLAEARAASLMVIADVKRGDVGSTVEAYGQAWLTPGSPLEADAITVSAYQGVGSLAAVRDLAAAGGKGLFILCATSNPESFDTQRALVQHGPHAGRTVAATIAAQAGEWNAGADVGSFGLVVGATVDLPSYGIDTSELIGTPLLAPGFGHQGAQFSDIRSIYGAAADTVVVSASRSILDAGPSRVGDAIRVQSTEVALCLA